MDMPGEDFSTGTIGEIEPAYCLLGVEKDVGVEKAVDRRRGTQLRDCSKESHVNNNHKQSIPSNCV